MHDLDKQKASISSKLYLFILDFLPAGSTILELGSGIGTQFLSQHYTIFSVEHDKKWAGKYDSTTYIYAPLVDDLWYDREILKKNLPKQYDLLLVDGPPTSRRRIQFWEHRDLFNLNVLIIIDDTVRILEKELAEKFRKLGKNVSYYECKKYYDKEFAFIT